MSADNWKHRGTSMRCATCMWFVPKAPQQEARFNIETGKYDPSERSLLGPTLGRCRRRAPKLGGWPAVFDSDWCGDHKIDENKL